MSQANENEAKGNGKGIFIILALFLLLFILPGGSYFYLKKGFSYQLKSRKELKDFGKIPNFTLKTIDGRSLNQDSLLGKATIVNFATLEELKDNEILKNYIYQYNRQFHDRKDFMTLTYVVGDSSTQEQLLALQQEYKLKAPEKWRIIVSNANTIEQLKNNFQLPNPTEPTFIIVDPKITIRRYYAALEEAEAGRLAEQMTIILPREAEKDIVLQRNKEY